MMSASCISSARAAYHLLKILSNSTVDCLTKDNSKPLTAELVTYIIDNTQGIMPHKSVLVKHIIGGKYPAENFYDPYKNLTGEKNVICSNNITDTRTLAELPVVHKLQQHFCRDIEHIHANIDTNPGTVDNFKGVKQPNLDFTNTIRNIWNNRNLAGRRTKVIGADQRCGTGMFQNSTSSTLGIVYYHSNGEPISFMNRVFTLEDLIKHDYDSFNGIIAGINNDGLENHFPIKELRAFVIDLLSNNKMSFREKHHCYEKYVWENIQLNSEYNRGLSFVFQENIDFAKSDQLFNSFPREFESLAGQRKFNWDKRGDCRDMAHIMLQAYGRTIDPFVVTKIHKLHLEERIVYNKKFLDDLAMLIKENVIYT